MKPKDKKTVFYILSLSLLFCIILSGCLPKPADNSSSEVIISESSEESSTSKGKSGVSYSLSIGVQYPGNMPKESEETKELIVSKYDYSGGEVKLNVIMQNGLKGIAKAGLIVLCDGVPVKYTLDKTGETGLFHTFDVEEKIVEKITLTPNFVSKIGRMDFIQVYDPGILNGKMYHTSESTIAMNLPENYEPDLTEFSVSELSSVPMSDGIRSSINGNMIKMWMYNENAENKMPAEWNIDLKGKTYVNFEAGETGTYRFVSFLDYELFEPEEGKSILEGELKKEEYASFLLPLKEMLSEGEHSFFTVAIRLDGNPFDYRPMVGARWKINN